VKRRAERRGELSRTEAAGRAWLPAAGPRRVGAGGPVSGERRSGAQRGHASDGDRDEHGVAGASDAIVVVVSVIIAGDTVRAEQSWKPNSAVQVEERTRPARVECRYVQVGSGSTRAGA
jgi:hypothetical protein